MIKKLRLFAWAVALNLLLVTVVGATNVGVEPQWLLRTEMVLENVGTTTMHRGRVQVPLMVEESAYGVVVSDAYNAEFEGIVVLDCGTRKGIFRVGSLEPGETFTIELQYEIASTGRQYSDAKPESTPQFAAQDGDITNVAKRVTEGLPNDEEKFRALQSFTHQHIRYVADSPWRNGDAIQALKHGEGVCEDYARLLVALAQSVGITSRTVYGYVYTPGLGDWYRHAWVEYLCEDGYWQSADPTFSPTPGLDDAAQYIAQGYQNVSARVRFIGGQLAGTWKEEVRELIQVEE